MALNAADASSRRAPATTCSLTLLVYLIGPAVSVLDSTAGEGGVLAAVGESHPALAFSRERDQLAVYCGAALPPPRPARGHAARGQPPPSPRFINLRVDAVLCDPPYNMKNPLLKAPTSSVAPWVSFAASRAPDVHLVGPEHALGSPGRRARLRLAARWLSLPCIRRSATSGLSSSAGNY